jgi:hypothetical protein
MARDGSGTYSRTNSRYVGTTTWQQDFNVNQKVDYQGHDAHDNDIATALTDSLSRTGKGAMLANLNLGGFKVTNLAEGTASNDLATLQQVQRGFGLFATAAGTAPNFTATLTPAPASISDGFMFRLLVPTAPTTGTITVNVNGLGAKKVYDPRSRLSFYQSFLGHLILLYDSTLDSGAGGWIIMNYRRTWQEYTPSTHTHGADSMSGSFRYSVEGNDCRVHFRSIINSGSASAAIIFSLPVVSADTFTALRPVRIEVSSGVYSFNSYYAFLSIGSQTIRITSTSSSSFVSPYNGVTFEGDMLYQTT